MGYAQHANTANVATLRERFGKFAVTVVAAAASAAMALTMLPLGVQTASAADNAFTDSGTVTTYAPTGVGNGTTTSPDVASTKYNVTANGTKVEAVQYTANGHNFDIARFKSDSRTPVITVTVPNEEISFVNIYPQRYYPATAYSVDKETNTLTFKMEKSLYEAIVMVNGDATNKTGKPYLAVINDPEEREGTVPDKTSAADGSGINEKTGVLNIAEYAKNWFKSHSNAEIQQANLVKATVSPWAGKTVGKTQIPADAKIDAGKIVPASTKEVTYPNERALAADDYTYVLQAALDEIKSNDKLNTLYFPNGTYIYGGLDIARWTTKHLNVYVDEGALLKNHVQPNREAMEPAIGIWSSKDITISGRGMFDNNGVQNYRQDNHDAYRSQHQGGVMVVKSQNITFNDTYMRDSKQWNYETHTAENVTFNNIKGLTPYGQPWVDGTDLASGKNLTINGVMTLGNDDAFASGHYNPGNQFEPTHADNIKGFGMNGDSPRTQEWIDAAAAYEHYSEMHNLNNLAWDTDDTENVTVNNTVNWSYAGGNGIRLGHSTFGHKLKNYTFNNFNPISFQGGGKGITVQNNTGTYPQYEDFTIRNSSFDTSRVGTNFSINGKDPLIKNVTVDNVWFSNANAGSNITNIENATLNDIYIGGKQVRYSNQNKLTVNNVTNLTYTYTDADGKTQPVKENTLPTFTSPEADNLIAKSNNVTSFKVAATDADEGDTVVVAVDKTTLPEGAKYDDKTQTFSWKPTEAQANKAYEVKFTAADKGAQEGDYDPVAKTVTITVQSSSSSAAPVEGAVSGDTFNGSWSGDAKVNASTQRTIRLSNASGDSKQAFVELDLSKVKTLGEYDDANLVLTYMGHRRTATATDEIALKATKTLEGCTGNNGAATSCSISEMTWNNHPKVSTEAADSVQSANFTVGNVTVAEGSEDQVKGNAIDGRKVRVDVSDFVRAAQAAKQTKLILALNITGSYEVRFVSTEGATTNKLNNATADMAPALEVTTVSPTKLTGPTAQSIEQYTAAHSDVFEITGVDPVQIALTGDTANGKITWNNDENRLEFAEGIPAGDHKVTVTLTDKNGAKSSVDFTLTVTAQRDTTAPVFSGVVDATVEFGAKFDPLAGVKAEDAVDGDVTASIKVEGTVDTKKAGEYTLTYTVTDAAGNKATATRTVTVKPEPVVLTGAVVAKQPTKVEYTVGETFNAAGLEVVKTFSDGSKSDPVASGEYDLKADVDLTKPFAAAAVGKVTVTVALKSDATKTATFNVTVNPDTTAPVFSGLDDATVAFGGTFDPLTGVSAKDAVDGDVTASIKVSGKLDTNKAGVYTLTYTAVDAAGNTATATRKVTVEKKGTTTPTPTPTTPTTPSKTPTTPVTPSKKPTLSNTGSEVSVLAWVLALAVVCGAGLMAVARRRSNGR
ncbi:DUF5011 domain-containing protein [Bifidobacterium jacchi]|uniref:DUF5011 domain-containing protein n=1 Tax=Bifidobacterium jacchi TaxID=2490545 RepID=A0A5N5RMI0_9BIFI|nr:DUF5011 domain-containing protein [Bifidobacterium jacchi]KAB5608546.1 DUF5011 domain-containing protein [Bifidobacterium jacchi]